MQLKTPSSFYLWLLFLIAPTILSAQQDLSFSNWHFGCNAGLSFREDGIKLIPSSIKSREGTASISSKKGNLLFYTDGRTIYNSRNKVTVEGLYGHSSSTTSVIAMPVPDRNEDEYWIFTNDMGLNNRGLNYYRYSVSKERIIEGPVRILSNQTEKMAALRPCEIKDYWLVAQDRNGSLHTWSVGEKVAKSKAPAVETGKLSNRETISYLKFSENGSWLVNALPNSYSRRLGGKVNIYQYSSRSGEITNPDSPIVLDFNHDEQGNYVGFPYGVEFSPFGRFLYVSVVTNDRRGREGGELYQYDMYAKNVNASRTLIAQASSSSMQFGSLLLGPDGRIYMAIEAANESSSSCPCYQAYPYLGVIETPDSKGTFCGFRQKGLLISNGRYTDECGYSSPSGGKVGLPAVVAGSLLPCYAR